MKRIYAEQFNKLLEDYYFNCELSGSRDLPFTILTNAAHHLHGWLFCLGDTKSAGEMKPLLIQLLNKEIPQPFDLDLCA